MGKQRCVRFDWSRTVPSGALIVVVDVGRWPSRDVEVVVGSEGRSLVKIQVNESEPLPTKTTGSLFESLPNGMGSLLNSD